VGDRLKHGERAAAFGRQRAERRLAPLERLLEPACAVLVVGGQPIRFLQHLADDSAVNQRVLANVDGRQEEAERLHAPQQAAHGKQARIAALVGAQAVRDELEIGDQLGRRLVRKSMIVVRRFEPGGHEAEEGAIRHLPVP
jgi:hypothetical protein